MAALSDSWEPTLKMPFQNNTLPGIIRCGMEWIVQLVQVAANRVIYRGSRMD